MAIHDEARDEWHMFEVVHREEDEPFTPIYHHANPTHSLRCLQPLTGLGQLHPGWLATLVQEVQTIPVPGETATWNCQDYVIEVWELMNRCGMVDDQTWYEGRERLMPYYGPDFGGLAGQEFEEGGEEDQEEEAAGEEEEGKECRVLSDEFVYDSSE